MKTLLSLSHAYQKLLYAAKLASQKESAAWTPDTNPYAPRESNRLYNQADVKSEEFVSQAQTYIQKHNISQRELINTFSKPLIAGEKDSIHPFLLIHLFWWTTAEKDNHSLKTLEALLRSWLKPGIKTHPEVYYIECLLDMWNYDSDTLIPIDILESCLLIEQDGTHNYDAFIKASAYLHGHPEEEIKKVEAKVRASKHFLEDEYYQEWM